MENFRNIKTTMYHNLFMIMLLKCCTNIMRWWSARHIPTIGKGKSASNIATTKKPTCLAFTWKTITEDTGHAVRMGGGFHAMF